MGSNTTPPWVDEKIIDKEKKNKIDQEKATRISRLEIENEKLKKRIKQLEEELNKIKK